LSKLQLETLKAILGAAQKEFAAAKTTQKVGEQEEAVIKALRQLVESEIAGTTAMKSHAKQATPEGKEAIEGVSEDVLAAAKAMLKQLAQIQAGIAKPGALNAKGKKTMALVKALEDKLLSEAAARRICVDLPGVQLQAGDVQSFARVTGDDAVDTFPQCRKKCLEHAHCKQVVFSKMEGCRLCGEATTLAVSFQDAYKSSFCGASGEKKALMKMLHAAYAKKSTVVIAK